MLQQSIDQSTENTVVTASGLNNLAPSAATSVVTSPKGKKSESVRQTKSKCGSNGSSNLMPREPDNQSDSLGQSKEGALIMTAPRFGSYDAEEIKFGSNSG